VHHHRLYKKKRTVSRSLEVRIKKSLKKFISMIWKFAKKILENNEINMQMVMFTCFNLVRKRASLLCLIFIVRKRASMQGNE
jgi:hypothetical protein